MSDFTQKWCIVSILDDIPEGTEFGWDEWPLHITVLPVFATPLVGSKLSELLSETTVEFKQFDLKAVEERDFGKTVTLMEMKPEILALHEMFVSKLSQFGVVFNNPEHVGPGYLPHCTFQANKKLDIGETVTIKEVSLVDMFPHSDGMRRKVVKSEELRQG